MCWGPMSPSTLCSVCWPSPSHHLLGAPGGRGCPGDISPPPEWYLETCGPVYEVEVQVIQLQGLQTSRACRFHQGLLMAGAPELQEDRQKPCLTGHRMEPDGFRTPQGGASKVGPFCLIPIKGKLETPQNI